MKKRLVALFMAAFMAATVLTACGDDSTEAGASDSSAVTPSSSTSSEVPAGGAADAMVSDETFSVLQDNYAVMVGYYDTIAEVYNSDEIAANPKIEEVMGKAGDVIVQMGEIQQNTLTEEDAVVLNNAIIDIVDGLTSVAESMELTEGNLASAETVEALQSAYASLVEGYNALATAYNNGEYEKNTDFEAVMNQSADIIEQMGSVSVDGLTEKEAQDLAQTMLNLIEQIGAFTDDVG